VTQPPGPAGRAAGRAAGTRAGATNDETTSIDPVRDVADEPAAEPPRRASARPSGSFAYQDSPAAAGAAYSLPGSAVLTTPIDAGRTRTSRSSRRPAPRRARLTLTRVDPWSVLKTALVFTTCLLVVWMVAVIVTYGILEGAGVFDSVNNNLSDALGTKINFNGPVILGGALIIGAFNVVLMSALATVAAFAYNVTVGLIGGIDVTLAERE
jgi:hypothetical protein